MNQLDTIHALQAFVDEVTESLSFGATVRVAGSHAVAVAGGEGVRHVIDVQVLLAQPHDAWATREMQNLDARLLRRVIEQFPTLDGRLDDGDLLDVALADQPGQIEVSVAVDSVGDG